MARLSPPAGFLEQRRGTVLWWLKVGWESLLPDLVPQALAAQSPHSSLVVPGGRGTIHRIELEAQGTLIVRPYRRGGFVRHFIRDVYWDHPPRPFSELCCTEEARERRVPTVEVLGAQVEWRLGVLYRGLLVTREAVDFHNLWNWLHTAPTADLRRATLSAVAHAIATMHQAGIAHADLNPTNILVSPDNDPSRALIIDFDRARLFSGPVPPCLREANLCRFRRFFSKYEVHQQWFSVAELEYFQQTYEAAIALKK